MDAHPGTILDKTPQELLHTYPMMVNRSMDGQRIGQVDKSIGEVSEAKEKIGGR